MADDNEQPPNGTFEEEAALRDRKSNSKAHRTLGVDTSAAKQRKVLGIDEDEHSRALKETADGQVEALAGGHSVAIPDEQIEAQLSARRVRRRASSYHPNSSHSLSRSRARSPEPSSSDNVRGDPREDGEPRDSDSVPSYENSSDNEPHSDGAARMARRRTRMDELGDSDDDEFDLDRRRWRSPSARGLIDADHEDGPLSTSAPRRYFYYYYDGHKRRPRRRRASFDDEHTPMIDKRANRKALEILGINPSDEKVMDILGIEQPEELETAVANSLVPPTVESELPQGRPLQPKALSTLGVPPVPTKADVLLGRIESHYEQTLFSLAEAFQLQQPFL